VDSITVPFAPPLLPEADEPEAVELEAVELDRSAPAPFDWS
jgi:hypothetical protein